MVTIVYSLFIRKKNGGSTKVPFSYPGKIYYFRKTSNHTLPLSSQRIDILNAINFIWTVVMEEAWMGVYQDLVD